MNVRLLPRCARQQRSGFASDTPRTPARPGHGATRFLVVIAAMSVLDIDTMMSVLTCSPTLQDGGREWRFAIGIVLAAQPRHHGSMAWVVRARELPFDSGVREWWIDDEGKVSSEPLIDADELPGRHVLMGLVDAHAHASVGSGAAGPVALGSAGAIASLDSWRAMGVAVVRDLGAPESNYAGAFDSSGLSQA